MFLDIGQGERYVSRHRARRKVLTSHRPKISGLSRHWGRKRVFTKYRARKVIVTRQYRRQGAICIGLAHRYLLNIGIGEKNLIRLWARKQVLTR